jgi:hypothetical protein
MSLGTILLITVVLLLIGAVSSWPYSRGWGYGVSGLLGTLLTIVVCWRFWGVYSGGRARRFNLSPELEPCPMLKR